MFEVEAILSFFLSSLHTCLGSAEAASEHRVSETRQHGKTHQAAVEARKWRYAEVEAL